MQTRASCALKSSPLEELHRVGRHHRQAEPAGEFHRVADVGLGAGMPGALDLDVEGVRKQPRPVGRELFGEREVAGRDRRADVAAHRTRQAQQRACGTILEPLAAHLGAAAVLVLEVGARQQLAQLTIARAVLADEQHALRLVALGLVADPGVHADDGLDALAARALVELDHAEQVGEIGDAERRHAVGRGGGDRLVELDDAVGDRIFGVQAEMHEARSARHDGRFGRGGGSRIHGADFTRRRPPPPPTLRATAPSSRWSCAPRGRGAPGPRPSAHSAAGSRSSPGRCAPPRTAPRRVRRAPRGWRCSRAARAE